jgi:hypothetical protein
MGGSFMGCFSNNMPINGYVSNRQRDKQNPRYAQMAIRVNAAGENGPFERMLLHRHGKLAHRITFATLLINGFIETAEPACALFRA